MSHPRPSPPSLSSLLLALTTAPTHALPTPHPSFLQPILDAAISNPSRSRSLNLASISATARFQLTICDITTSNILDHDSVTSLPDNVNDRTVVSSTLLEDVFVQVLEVEDIGRSKWEQIEQLEAERKGETTKGREIIRVIPQENTEGGSGGGGSGSTQRQSQAGAAGSPSSHQQPTTTTMTSKGPFKLLLQDHNSTTVWAFELKRVEKIGYPPLMGIGCKLWLKKGTQIARGVILLEPERTVVVGGRIESLDTKWKEGREERLRTEVKMEQHQQQEGRAAAAVVIPD